MADRSAKRPERAVVIGASAGAMEALGRFLPALPRGFPWPIAVVVHVPSRTPSLLAQLFAPRCALRVMEAEDKLPFEPGAVYFAPPDYHLLIEARDQLALSIDAPVHFSRPSIDVLFVSAAETYAESALGIVLSGANQDGAQGLAAIAAVGGATWVQMATTASARTMPEAALRAAPRSLSLSPDEMAIALCELTRNTPPIR